MIEDYDDDTHFCLKCHTPIIGLDNYVNHRKAGCSKNIESPKSPLPSQLLPPDESFSLKADDFFSSLELRSSSKPNITQSTSGKNFSGILTRSKTTAVIQATTAAVKDTSDTSEVQQSKSGKNVWIGGHQFKELGNGDNQSKLIKAVANLERRKEEPTTLRVYEESDDEFEDYDFEDDSSDDDQDIPPRNYTGGKWKPTSPIQWSKNTDRDWNIPPPTYTGGKWKPSSKRSSSPPASHTKGKWKPSYSNQKDYYEVPPPTFTKGKWVSSKKQEYQDIPPPTHTKGKWKPRLENEDEFPPSNHTKGKWRPKAQTEDDTPPSTLKGKWKSRNDLDDEFPPPSHTKGKWKPRSDTYDEYPPPSHTKGKWKPKNDTDEDYPPPSQIKGKWKPKNDNDNDFPPPGHTKGKWKPRNENYGDSPPPDHTKGKWKPRNDNNDDFPPPCHTKGKWKPKNTEDEFIPSNRTKRKSRSKSLTDENIPLPSHTKGKWKPKADLEMRSTTTTTSITATNKTQITPVNKTLSENKDIDIIASENQQNKLQVKETLFKINKSTESVQFWCGPCNRRLASKIVYERHLKSELHFKRTLRDREFDDTEDLILLKDARRAKIKPPESIFSGQDKNSSTITKKRNRKKIYIRCDVCQSKVNKHLIGKHLISHYHCRKGDITTSLARSMVLENIYGIVLESPFQCSVCKFYCNTQEDFLRHWLTDDHINKNMPGYFFCIFCKYRSEETKSMYEHLVSPEHIEVVSVINRSVPIVIKKINPTRCLTCNKEFVFKMQLLKHCEKFNHDNSVAKTFRNDFICESCGEGFLSNVSLQRHRQKAHNEKYYVCTPCKLKFKDPKEAKAHRRSLQHKYIILGKKSDGLSLKRRCEYCEENFPNFLLLKEHLKNKHPEHKIRCPHCGAEFTVTQEMTIHLRSKSCKFEENPQNTLRCEKCLFSSNSSSELLFHIALHDEPLVSYPAEKTVDSHAKPTPRYKCPICEKFFPKSSLHPHIRLHTQERPFVCKICDARFARKNNLQFHVKNHDKKKSKKVVTGNRSFLCSTCGASFKRKSVLQQHMQIHTGKLCKCPKLGCIYTARRPGEIREHFKTHFDEKNYECASCDYKGKTKSQLSRHMTIHGKKKYQCSQCSFTTRTTTHLKRHARLHTGAKPFSCPHCAYKCNNLENLRKHVLSTNKHPGKSIYECKFCTGDDHFQANFAKEFKIHLVTKHFETFWDSCEAATYVAGIYEVQNDGTYLNEVMDIDQPDDSPIDQTKSKRDVSDENVLNLETDDDPIVYQLISDAPSTSTQSSKDQSLDQMFPRFVIPKDEVISVENSPDIWNLVGRYDVEEESGTLIPFQSVGERLFQDHFP